MAKELPARFGIKPHPSRRLVTVVYFAIGVIPLVGAVRCFAVGDVTDAIVGLSLGAIPIGLGLYIRSDGAAVQVLNKAFNAALSGQLRDAEELLDYAEETFWSGRVQRLVDGHRAFVAMRRGELEAALHRADAAIARPLGLLSAWVERLQLPSIHALRALLRASTGDRPGAQADIDAVQNNPLADPEALARAAFAQAVLLERAGDKEALRAHLVRERRLLIEHTHPRERAIVRGYERMLKATSTTVYRTGTPREEALAEEPALTDWAAKIAPGAAPFVGGRGPASRAGQARAPREAEAVDPAARAAAEERFKRAKKQERGWTVGLLAFVGVLLGAPVAVRYWRTPDDGETLDEALPPPAPIEAPDWMLRLLPFLFIGLIAGGLYASFAARFRRTMRQLFAARGDLARGHEDRAARALAALAKHSSPLVAAQAHLALAELGERRGDLGLSLAECEAGLARLGSAMAQIATADIALPGLLAERAFVLAAMNRAAEAQAEIAVLAERYPSYAFLDRSKLRVALVQKARHGDAAGAARIAAERADQPLNARDELLADLARAVGAKEAAGAGELTRLREELQVDAEARRWLEVVAPVLLAAWHRSAEAPEEGAAASG